MIVLSDKSVALAGGLDVVTVVVATAAWSIGFDDLTKLAGPIWPPSIDNCSISTAND